MARGSVPSSTIRGRGAAGSAGGGAASVGAAAGAGSAGAGSRRLPIQGTSLSRKDMLASLEGCRSVRIGGVRER
jgi:hypothetical protein